jgi:hypothetical protein
MVAADGEPLMTGTGGGGAEAEETMLLLKTSAG